MRRWAAHTWVMALVVVVAVIIIREQRQHDINTHAATPLRDTLMGVQLEDEGQARAKTWRYTARMENGQHIYLYLQSDTIMPVMGDRLLVETRLQEGGMLGKFNYGRYLRQQGIAGSGWVGKGRWMVVDHIPVSGWKAKTQQWQRQLFEQYRQMGLHEPELGILGALTLGYREELNKEVKESFSKAGAMHVLAVSGLHTGIVWGMIVGLLTLGGRRKPFYNEKTKRWGISLVCITILWCYAVITGLSPSVVRSAVMLTLMTLSKLLARPQSSLNILAAAAVLILMVRPLDLWSVSMQLSFAAMAALLIIVPRWQQKMYLPKGAPRYFGELILVSVAAQLGTMPLTLYYFEQTSNYFALTNLIVIPLAGVAMPLGLIALLLGCCPIGGVIGKAAGGITYLMRIGVEWVEQLPGSTTHIAISAWSVGLLYAAIVMGCLMMHGRKVRWAWLVGVVACVTGAVIVS